MTNPSKKFVKYTIQEFRKDFPNDESCLKYLFKMFYGTLQDFDKYYLINGRKEFVHSITGEHISPLANTIFHKSSTPLTVWFEAIYKFADSRNGVSAKELQRDFGVTYKCAWRMASQIRTLFSSDSTNKLKGVVEADETYIGGEEKNKHSNKKTKGTQGRSVKTKTPVIGVVERKGEVVAKVVENTKSSVVMPFIKENVEVGTNLMTDTYPSYNQSSKMGYNHQKVDHGNGEYVKDDIYTNTLEGFWSQMKRSIDGTYHMVSPNHLQKYVNEFAFRYNHNHSENHLFKTILNSRIKNNLSI